MIEKILCFLFLIICLVYGLALLSWLVMKLDIEKRRSKRTKFFERMGENLMEIEKLIKHMREEAQDYRSGRTLGRAFVDAEDVLDEAATALEQLQAENGRLQAELEKEEAVRKKQADILYELRGQKYEQTTAIDQLRAENDRLKRERDAAVEAVKNMAEYIVCAGRVDYYLCDEISQEHHLKYQPKNDGNYDNEPCYKCIADWFLQGHKWQENCW